MVAHGPEIFDSGYAAWLASCLSPAKIIVAGIMARVAAEESGLSCEFAHVPPSVVIQKIKGPCFLANQGKTAESGRVFGEIVAQKLGDRGLIHVECSSREVICWRREPNDISREIAHRTGFPLVRADVQERTITHKIRVIRGCIPGEPVFVNGTIIGCATNPEVVLAVENGHLVPRSGLWAKDHGIEKLERAGPVDLSTAWCKSGSVRSQLPRQAGRPPRRGRVVFIDHCGHDLFRKLAGNGVCGIVSIGDDTTAVCGHIGAHLGIPVLGIVDGDTDGIVPPVFAPGSVVVCAEGISDDELGRQVAKVIPPGEEEWEVCVEKILSCIGTKGKVSTPQTV
ncbi:MAG: DUF2117 domain-containing protein [Methanolinea sp.]|nr:DUF2117 domain-containing protein [Methanolinea sp.]